MIPFLKKYRGPLLYLFFGLLTTLINTLVFFACSEYFLLSTWLSNSLAWLFAVLFAFLTNKVWVFESSSFKADVLLKEFILFAACRVVTGLLDTGIVVIGVDYLHYPSLWVKIFSNMIVVILNYIFSKLIIFRNKKDSQNKEKPD